MKFPLSRFSLIRLPAIVAVSATVFVVPAVGGGQVFAAEKPVPPGKTAAHGGGNQPPLVSMWGVGGTVSAPDMMAAETAPVSCPDAPPDSSGWVDEPGYRWTWTEPEVDVKTMCEDAVRLAPTPQAQRAIRYAFSKLGTPYSQNSELRTTTHFDCSSFVGRAYSAAGAYIYQNGRWKDFFTSFGWTGAYTKFPPYAGFPAAGYAGSNLNRVTRAQLLPGDIIIKFSGSDAAGPALSAGNNGHAQIYLGGGKVIESSDRVAVSWVSPSTPVTADWGLNNEWYYRWMPVRDSGGYSPDDRPNSSMVLPAGEVRRIPAPAGGTVVGNLTAVSAAQSGWAVAWPCDKPKPGVSSVQFVPGRPSASMVVTKASSAGEVCLYSPVPVHLVFDMSYAGNKLSVYEETVRKLDTRSTLGARMGAGTVTRLYTGAEPGATVMGVVAALNPSSSGHLSVFPCDQPKPSTSTVNFVAGGRAANMAVVPAAADGTICIYSTSETDILFDQASDNGPVSRTPVRRYDSRLPIFGTPEGNDGHRIAPGREIVVRQAQPWETVTGTVTVTDPLNPGHGTIYPCSSGKGATSSINFVGQQTVANTVMVQADNDGKICWQGNEWVHVIWDDSSETRSLSANTPERVLDTRHPGLFPWTWFSEYPETGGPSTW